MPAFVFPGQGSQRPGMGRAWVDHPSWELVADASEAASRDLEHLLLDAGQEELTETRNAQLATFTIGLLVLDAVERLGIEPTSCAGHSLGEYTALVAAGALSFEDGVRVVTERGEAMQAAADARPGTMVLLDGCDDESARIACRLADGAVWVANYNTPDEVVLAGEPAAVERAAEIALGMAGGSAVGVAVGGAFHTPFMAPARDRLRKALAATTFHEPEVAVVANVDAMSHVSAAEWDALLRAQVVSPVRWHQSVLRLAGLAPERPSERGTWAPERPSERGTGTGDAILGERLFAEVGPGGSLSSMIRRTVPGVTTVAVAVPDDLDRLVDAVAGATALHAFAAGHQGEHLYVSERMVISPRAGVFEPAGGLDGGLVVEVGTLLGSVSGSEVRSAFAGTLMGMLAQAGERVQTGQPIAWLRAM
ncbi:MAG TPA: ACP S-malonyltransferase [Acidimicrobiales bacterium]|nr:ACP S-malonyltransferase [Acidimicrobiales bacterium]